ncbi:hypothetical protein L1887_23855 [Cichorium endivia]|nr:hypothetical protein L1887_23855 [Cichorium endivia]
MTIAATFSSEVIATEARWVQTVDVDSGLPIYAPLEVTVKFLSISQGSLLNPCKHYTLDLLARVCLVDEDENMILHTYVEPQVSVTDYRDTAAYRPLLKTNSVSHSLKYLTKTYLGSTTCCLPVSCPFLGSEKYGCDDTVTVPCTIKLVPCQSVSNTGEINWLWNWRNNFSSGTEQNEFNDPLLILSNLDPISSLHDTWVWNKGNNGEFSYYSMRSIIDNAIYTPNLAGFNDILLIRAISVPFMTLGFGIKVARIWSKVLKWDDVGVEPPDCFPICCY